jgi:carboxyl-terminal processing protease
MEKKQVQIWMPLFLSLSMIAGVFIGYKMKDGIPGKSFFYMEKRRPIQEILDLIENKYVDQVNLNSITDTAIQALLAKLDPHSTFIPAADLSAVNDDIKGSFYGIGIEFEIFDDTLNIINVLKDGPGFKAGLLSGDKLMEANGINLAGKKVAADSIRKILRGERGSSLQMKILRNAKVLSVEVKRDIIPLTSVDASYMFDSESGYIRLNKFSSQTYREFMMALEDLNKAGMKKLVLDLRGNGGGVLEEAVEIADEFLEGDKLITYTEGKHVPRKEFRCRRQGQFEKGKLIVLADEGSASASEVLLGALQDWDRAVIVGRRSFGKGLVQEQFDLSDRSALRLTIARYYTPLGRSIQRSYANGEKAYYDEIVKRYSDGDSMIADSVQLKGKKVYSTPSGKKLYGGGGITPDYSIASDTGKIDIALAKVYAKGTISRFGYQYFLNHRNIVNEYKEPALFSKSYQVTDADWNDFVNIASRDSIRLDSLKQEDKDFLLRSLKASIARQLWRNNGYFEVYNESDKTIQKARELLK